MLSVTSGVLSNPAFSIQSGASDVPSNTAGAISPAVSGVVSIVPLELPASLSPAVVVLPVVVTACRYAARRYLYTVRCCRRIALNRRVAVCSRSPICRWCAA